MTRWSLLLSSLAMFACGPAKPAVDVGTEERPVVKEFFAQPFTDEVMKERTVVVSASGDLAYDIGADNLITKTE